MTLGLELNIHKVSASQFTPAVSGRLLKHWQLTRREHVLNSVVRLLRQLSNHGELSRHEYLILVRFRGVGT
jgi:hypothetical protein